MRHVVTTATLSILALESAGAQAGSLGRACTTAPESELLTPGELQARLVAQGYRIEHVRITKACGKSYAYSKSGAKSEIFADPTNGTVVATK